MSFFNIEFVLDLVHDVVAKQPLPAQRQKGMAFSRDYGLMKSPQTHSVLMLVTPIGLAGGVILQAPHLFSVKLLLPAEEPTIEDAIAELLG
jgi:hypothetical protein